MTPTLFSELYSLCFSTSYDSGQESTWWWLTNEHMWDFSTLCFTKDQPPCLCMVSHKGHQPKMLLWMLEAYIYILGHLHDKDWDGCIVLGHEILLLVWSCCCRKWGEAEGHIVPLHSWQTIYLPAPPIPWSALGIKDMVSLEHLTWTVYDNLLTIWPGVLWPGGPTLDREGL